MDSLCLIGGLNNAFYAKCKTKLAKNYWNAAVLECHHLSNTIHVLEKHNINQYIEDPKVKKSKNTLRAL